MKPMSIKNKILDGSFFNLLAIAISVGIGMYALFILIFNMDKGFDITDESFYILWAQFPESVVASVNPFGFYTGIIYDLSGEDIVLFRMAGICLLMTASFFFSKELYQYVLNISGSKWTRTNMFFFSFPIVVSSLAYYRYWLITPSYNWLNLVGIILFSTGLIRHINCNASNEKYSVEVASILIALGGWLTFVAKPISTVILVILAVFWVAFNFKKIRWRNFFVVTLSLVLMLMLFHALYFNDGPVVYYDRVISGLEALTILGTGHTFTGTILKAKVMLTEHTFMDFYMLRNSQLQGGSIAVFILSIIALYTFKRNGTPIIQPLIKLVLGIFTAVYSYILYVKVLKDQAMTGFWMVAFELMSVVFIVYIIVSCFDKIKGFEVRLLSRAILLVLFLCLLSLSYAFGTANNIIHTMSGSAIFTIASIVVMGCLIDSKEKFKIFSSLISIASAFYALTVVNYAYEHPYRLVHRISEQQHEVSLSINDSDNKLYVDTETKEYIVDLKRAAISNDWIAGNTLIDMTGGTPGANVILDAQIIAFPWLVGGYPGSSEHSSVMLSTANIEVLKEAWLLVSPEGRRRLPLKILENFNLDFPSGYVNVGQFKTAHRGETQELWKPKK